MAKSKLTETKKITHKLATEGELTVVDGLVIINIPDEGVKNVHELLKNFSGCYIKLAITEESVEDVEQDYEDSEVNDVIEPDIDPEEEDE